MGPTRGIPTRPCVFCKSVTNETESIMGVHHYHCYSAYIESHYWVRDLFADVKHYMWFKWKNMLYKYCDRKRHGCLIACHRVRHDTAEVHRLSKKYRFWDKGCGLFY